MAPVLVVIVAAVGVVAVGGGDGVLEHIQDVIVVFPLFFSFSNFVVQVIQFTIPLLLYNCSCIWDAFHLRVEVGLLHVEVGQRVVCLVDHTLAGINS